MNTKKKTTWNIIKYETGKKVSKVGLHILNTDWKLTNDQQTIANSCFVHRASRYICVMNTN